MDLLNKRIQGLKLGQEEHKTSDSGTTGAAPKHAAGLFDKISSVLSDNQTAPPAVSVAHPQESHQKVSVMDKVTNTILGNDAHKHSPPPPAVARPQQKNEHSSLFDKLGEQVNQAISGHKTPKAAPAPAKQEQLFDKITSVLSGKPEPQPQKPQTLSDKISGKINDALGGGQTAEMKEDKLDKAIDLFQQHVLKEGPQNNESAIEQAKDKQIADAIRKAVNRPREDNN